MNTNRNGVLGMKYFTYGYEDYDGNKGEITVRSNTKEESWSRIHDYEVSKGELHYAWFKCESDTGTERYYSKDNKSLGLAIALVGAALGCCQIRQYGIKKNYSDCLKDNVTIKLISQ